MKSPEFLSPDFPCPEDPSTEQLAQAYLAYFQAEPHDPRYFWAYELLSELVEDRPDEAWTVIVTLIELCHSEECLAIVAAGPIEDLLCNHGHGVLARIQAEAGANPRFRRALKGVWGANRMDHFVRSAIDAIVQDDPPL
jgi:hypothetical protein